MQFRADSVVFAALFPLPTMSSSDTDDFAGSGLTALALDASAADAAGNIGMDSILVTVVPDEPPVIN